jgi:hypothetical protein
MLLKAGTVVRNTQYAIRKPCQTVLRNTQKAASIRNCSKRCVWRTLHLSLCRLLFSSPKHRYDRQSCCCCSISIARARRALTQHTHRRGPLGTRLNLSYAAAGRECRRPRRATTGLRGSCGPPAYGVFLLPCQHANRCTLHWSKWLIPCRRC